ncbi:hypothetical protein CMI42_04860 [Candidatus Pacearchaeota archaeon]|nr:hypothetical protein [Candidatus Pacearchaeota archaeon]|tara:strand:- start:3016 stop:3234 length:219 start_codon:yes stop_codon:yes gene_type:complete
MVTTIQIDDRTLDLLKTLKEEINARSYDEAIVRIVGQRNKKSFAGSLKKYFQNDNVSSIARELQNERRKERF